MYKICFVVHRYAPYQGGSELFIQALAEECVKQGAAVPPAFRSLGGCAVYNKYSCTIYTAKTTTMEILGHELRHCFEGKFHN